MKEVRQTRERGAPRDTIRSMKKKDHSENYQKAIGMPRKVFEQGSCIIKMYYGKINLALLCEWFEGEGLKKEGIVR